MKIEKYVDTVSRKRLDKKIEYYNFSDNGDVLEEFYYLRDALHREDGPAEIKYYKSGKIKEEYYYLIGRLHKEDGPAGILYYESGKVEAEEYCLNDKCHHRENGPAVIWYYESGEIMKKEYYINGIECDILQEMVIRGLEEKII